MLRQVGTRVARNVTEKSTLIRKRGPGRAKVTEIKPRVFARSIFTRDPNDLKTTPLSNRVFGKIEKFVGAHNFYYGGCFHIVRVIQFHKKIDPEILVDALDDMHVRHPMLSQQIIRAPIVGGAFKNSDADIPLVTITDAASEGVISKLVDSELNTPINNGLVLRVTLVQSEDEAAPKALVLTFNHAGCDAVSAASVTTELFDRYVLLEKHEAAEQAARETGDNVTLKEPEIEILPDIAGIESFLPFTHRLFGGLKAAGSIYRKESAKVDKEPKVLDIEIPAVPAGAMGRLAGVKCLNMLVQTPAHPILTACKRFNVPVTYGITAALLMSSKRHIFDKEDEETQQYVYQIGVDLRKQFNPPIEAKYLMPMAGVTHNIAKVHGSNLWTLAKTLQETDQKSLDDYEPFNLTNYLLATNATFGDSVSRRPGPVLTVSNLGVSSLSAEATERFQCQTIIDFKTNKLPQIQVVASTYGETMNLAVTYPQTPSLEADDVEETITDAISLLVDTASQ